ncbi:MAG: hypothetical protein ABSA16_13985 [Thermoguttaceae bacterium]|jgi:hypothetical protein
MNDPREHIDDNVARLIQAGFAAETRPDPAAHARMFECLAYHLQRRQSGSVFPEWIVIAIVGIVFFLAAWLAVQFDWTGMRLNMTLLCLLVASAVFLNILFIPIAIIIILIRRGYV